MSLIIHAPGFSPDLPFYDFVFKDGWKETLVFDVSTWTYYRCMPDGSRIPLHGVTSILKKVIDKSPQIARWAVKQAMLRLRASLIERHFATDGTDPTKLKLLFTDVLDEIIADAKRQPEREFEEAGDLGTIAHKHIEQTVKSIMEKDDTRTWELLAKLPEDERAENSVIAAYDWFNKHDCIFEASERKVFYRPLLVAGTADCVARVSSCSVKRCCPNPFISRKSLLDFKTSNGLYVSYLFQMAIYRAGLNLIDLELIDDAFLMRLDKETADFEVWHAEGAALDMFLKGFVNALELSRSMDDAEDWISQMKEQDKVLALAEKTERLHRACAESEEYKGMRQKKNCRGIDRVCDTCTAKFLEKHHAQ